ncbi:MAG: hypothetical protein MRZ79_19960 [Bacteroidia bacterium]|nr:hypothetical protein [Bacteroidia bacterium]
MEEIIDKIEEIKSLISKGNTEEAFERLEKLNRLLEEFSGDNPTFRSIADSVMIANNKYLKLERLKDEGGISISEYNKDYRYILKTALRNINEIEKIIQNPSTSIPIDEDKSKSNQKPQPQFASIFGGLSKSNDQTTNQKISMPLLFLLFVGIVIGTIHLTRKTTEFRLSVMGMQNEIEVLNNSIRDLNESNRKLALRLAKLEGHIENGKLSEGDLIKYLKFSSNYDDEKIIQILEAIQK